MYKTPQHTYTLKFQYLENEGISVIFVICEKSICFAILHTLEKIVPVLLKHPAWEQLKQLGQLKQFRQSQLGYNLITYNQCLSPNVVVKVTISKTCLNLLRKKIGRVDSLSLDL